MLAPQHVQIHYARILPLGRLYAPAAACCKSRGAFPCPILPSIVYILVYTNCRALMVIVLLVCGSSSLHQARQRCRPSATTAPSVISSLPCHNRSFQRKPAPTPSKYGDIQNRQRSVPSVTVKCIHAAIVGGLEYHDRGFNRHRMSVWIAVCKITVRAITTASTPLIMPLHTRYSFIIIYSFNETVLSSSTASPSR